MLNDNLKKVTNRGSTELQVLRLIKKFVIIHFCFVSDVLQSFFFALHQFFYKKIFFEEVTLKYTTILHILAVF